MFIKFCDLKSYKNHIKMEITESFIQQSAYMWFVNNYGLKKHEPNRCTFFSVPNELAMGIRSALLALGVSKSKVDQAISIAIKKVKNTGFLPGVSDTIIILPNSVTLYVEFKTATGSQSDEQKEFQLTCQQLGHHYYLCRSLTEFQSIIKSHLT